LNRLSRPEGGLALCPEERVYPAGAAVWTDDALVSIREETGLLQLALRVADVGTFDWDLTTGVAYLSPESLGFFHLPQDGAADLAAAMWTAIMHPDDVAGVMRAAARAVEMRSTYRAEFRVCHPGEPDRWILGIGRVKAGAGSEGTRIVGLNFDLTELRQAEETQRAHEAALRASEERLALAMDAASDGLWDLNVQTGEAWFSERWFTMLGYRPNEYQGRFETWELLVNPDDRDRASAKLAEHLEGRSATYECEVRMRRKNGSWCWILTRGKVVSRDEAGKPIRIVGTHIDIDARKAAEAQVAYMAGHDTLTDLPNRRLFRERLDHVLAEVCRHGKPCAVLCLDLDRFKAVNDRLGHLAGDTLLSTVASRLKSLVRADDTLARLGGDEFAILLGRAGTWQEIAGLAKRLIAAVEAPVTLGQQQAEVGLSVGIAIAPDHCADSDGLLNRADLALYRAKAEGRNTYRFFEPVMDDQAAERRRLAHDLRLALKHEAFVVYYQPQLRCTTQEIVGFEALVRWQHPERGLVMPGTFIPLAEETGLIVDLGAWVLRSACREAAGWAVPLKVAVNVSPRQFQHADLVDLVGGVLAETGLAPSRLELEITEGVIINDMAGAAAVVHRLKALGVRIAMDDFGTGHSSLATLQAVPFDRIKIDRSFVGQVETSPQAAVIVRAVLGLGKSLGMEVMAEGVETEGQRCFLIEEACEEMQGFLFGTPQPIEAFAALLRR
jgi:diguanylate cyclase (GGDEF)-like protein/PAS domain S-box-containing protein